MRLDNLIIVSVPSLILDN